MLIFVSAVALLLAGFVGVGGAIGLWEPVHVQSSARDVTVRMLQSGDARAASESPPDTNPPVSVRSALLVALASAAFALLLAGGSRFARWLSDVPYALRTGPAGRWLREAGFGDLAWPVVRGRAVRSHPRQASAVSVRLWSRSTLSESSESLVMFVLSIVLGVVLGILVALYAG